MCLECKLFSGVLQPTHAGFWLGPKPSGFGVHSLNYYLYLYHSLRMFEILLEKIPALCHATELYTHK